MTCVNIVLNVKFKNLGQFLWKASLPSKIKGLPRREPFVPVGCRRPYRFIKTSRSFRKPMAMPRMPGTLLSRGPAMFSTATFS